MAKAGRGAVMAATVISNDSGAELVGSRSSQNTLDPVTWSNKPSLETHGRRNSAGRCIACWWVASTYRLSCNPSAVWRSPRTTAGPVRARRESSLSLCLLLGMSSPHTSPGVFNGPRLGRMKGIYHSGKAFMLCICTWTISIVLKDASGFTFDPPHITWKGCFDIEKLCKHCTFKFKYFLFQNKLVSKDQSV